MEWGLLIAWMYHFCAAVVFIYIIYNMFFLPNVRSSIWLPCTSKTVNITVPWICKLNILTKTMVFTNPTDSSNTSGWFDPYFPAVSPGKGR